MEERKPLNKAKNLILGRRKPPWFLSLLCMITFAWSGMLMLLFALLTAFVLLSEDLELKTQVNEILNAVKADERFFGIYAGLHMLSLLGAVQMWRLKRFGFYVFSLASIALIVLPLIMLSGMKYDWTTYIFTGTMILLYAFNLRKMD